MKKRIATNTYITRATSLLMTQQKLEQELKMSYDTQGWEDENKVVNAMKLNPKAFFAYGRAKQKTKARVGLSLTQKLMHLTLTQTLLPSC